MVSRYSENKTNFLLFVSIIAPSTELVVAYNLKFRMLHLTTKEHPCQVYSELMPSKQIIGQTITYNGTTSGIEVQS